MVVDLRTIGSEVHLVLKNSGMDSNKSWRLISSSLTGRYPSLGSKRNNHWLSLTPKRRDSTSS